MGPFLKALRTGLEAFPIRGPEKHSGFDVLRLDDVKVIEAEFDDFGVRKGKRRKRPEIGIPKMAKAKRP